MVVYNDFITSEEEESLFNEVEPYLKRMRYQYDHWDNVSIYSETRLIRPQNTHKNLAKLRGPFNMGPD